MPFDFQSFAESIGLPSLEMPDFPAPERAPLRKPLHDARLGLFVSCGVRLKGDAPLAVTNDLTYRLVPCDAPSEILVLDHESPVRFFPDKDLAVAYPAERLDELAREGWIGSLAPQAVSMVGSISLYERLMSDTLPAVQREFEDQEVDLVLLVAFCPGCHRSVSLLSRGLEKQGLPTVTLVTVSQTAAAFKPPRAAFLDYPVGCPAGRPGDPEDQRAVLRAALALAERPIEESWAIHELPFTYEPDGSRRWEQVVEQLYRERYSVLASHTDDHRRRGDSLAGKEEDFVVRCNC
ncbi:MAG TPA: hypothetical protein VMD59_06515 [Acidimicrobiales bacterium]|nr:hypothetical protein [Acidimicrobiales bacterium]